MCPRSAWLDGALFRRDGCGVLLPAATCGDEWSTDMRLLVDEPARLEWSEFQPVGRWQKNDPVQRHMDVETVSTGVHYAKKNLPNAGRLAIIRLQDGRMLYWETWSLFCE
jgi:hypothetical protein